MSYLAFDSLPDPSGFELGEVIAKGYCAKVYKAKNIEKGTFVAMKVQPYDKEHQVHIEEEYRILRDYSSCPNIPDFYGVFRKKKNDGCDEIWFATEYCAGGTAVDLVNRMLAMDRRMKEEHIAFIIREAGKALLELNRNHFIHRDVRGSNILITKNGEIKLCDFGLTREVDSTIGKRGTCIGSPCWMAPELVTAQEIRSNEIYDSRSDVWALGITAIELGDGRPPFFDMHPTRAMFQIVRNPPPTLTKISNWTQNYNDFITECLEKNPENRPLMMEIIEHPFLSELEEQDFALQEEIKQILEISRSQKIEQREEVGVDCGFIKKLDQEPEKMYVEDLAAIENPNEERVMDHLSNRLERGQSYSFIGDILLSMNSNDIPLEYSEEYHSKYKFKSRSENAPHIFSVADLAYQDMMHHKTPQHVLFSGESYSGKTTNVRLFIEHTFFLGSGNRGATERVQKSMNAITMLTNAGTPLNNDSTRCAMQYTLTFGSTGKLSGAVFLMHLLEKIRVSTTDMQQHNFHIFYYFYDYIEANDLHRYYSIDAGRNYRYLRIPAEKRPSKLKYVRDQQATNAARYVEFEEILTDLDLSKKDLETIRKILSAILNLGNLRFKQNDQRTADFEDHDFVARVADLLRLDEKKFQWSLLNYCKVKGGTAERKRYTAEEARDCRDALAATIYNRLVDWIINKINMNLAFPRAVFGDSNAIFVYDFFGFECFERNGIEQLMINTLNEQMQYHYSQTIFANLMFEQEMDAVPPISLNYYDNKQVLDQLLTKPEGLFSIIDDVSKSGRQYDALIDKVNDKRSQFVKKHSNTEISITHYTGKIIYDVRSFPDSNRDFVPPEIIESMKSSLDEVVVLMFTNQLSKCGNLTMAFDESKDQEEKKKKPYALNTLSQGQYSQVNQMRSLSTVFRAICLHMLKALSSRADNVGYHFVRCIRAELEYEPRKFHRDMVHQQLKAMSVTDTILARQQGYSCRITFQEFLKRYQFLAFDFDETVDITKDNCRLLLVRLKMEGWAIGKSKVFLRYYNDEFLSRLYEIQVKKIIKVQAMMRSYISRRKMQKKGSEPLAAKIKTTAPPISSDEAALKIQKAYRGYKVRQQYGPLMNDKTGQIDQSTAKFLNPYVKRWRAKSLFQVLLHYRAARFLDLVNLSQQVHLYNQRIVTALHVTSRGVTLDKIDNRQTNASVFGPMPLPTRKIPFRLIDIPYYDTSYMCEPINPLTNFGVNVNEEEEAWDAPLQNAPSLTQYLLTYNAFKKEQSCQTNWDRRDESDVVHQQQFNRDPKLMQKMAIPNREYQRNNNMSSSSNYRSSATNRYSPNDRRITSSTQSGFGDSRRNSLSKKRNAPTPPPMQGMRNDASWMRNNARPSNPVRELEMMGRRTSMDNNFDNDDPPFNFKAMLRKTNYRPEDNNNYTSSRPVVSSSPRRFSSGNAMRSERPSERRNEDFPRKKIDSAMNMGSSNMRDTSMRDSSSMSNLSSSANYVEQEIAPGVTLQGYAYNI